MSQQKPDPVRPRPRRATMPSKTPRKNGPQPPEKTPTRPAPADLAGWKTHWTERGQPWRMEPEISEARQQELAQRYTTVTPDIERGIYPFGGVKLSLADIEWLLATYADTFTPRAGLDVRGANLDDVDLGELPLSGLVGGLTPTEWAEASYEQLQAAMVHMNHVSLREAQLDHAHLSGAQLHGADLTWACLVGADLSFAELQGADLSDTQLQGADLSFAELQETTLFYAHLQGADLYQAALANAEGIGPRLADAHWDGTNLAVVEWSQLKMLGDEAGARLTHAPDGAVRMKEERLRGLREAVRANRQLALALQAQGLSEEASRFFYRANLCQRKVLWFQMLQPHVSLWRRTRTFGAWIFSHLLNVLAGYGYRPERSFLAYLLVIFGFMGLYLLTSHFTTPHLRWDEALVLSLSSFHGRGFFPQTISLGDVYARLAVTEAVLGLFVEVSFIATFTQRFFGK